MARRTRYFEKFPIVDYNNNPAINIVRRPAFNDKVKSFLTAFYEHEIKEDTRVETIAFDYYGDVDYDWLIYLTNSIIDPYYEFATQNEVFESSIKKKYGSIENATRKIRHYTSLNNSEEYLSESAYNALPGSHKKYWEPEYSQLGLLGYKRSEYEIIANTNMIRFGTNNTQGSTPFEEGETVVDINDTDTRAEVIHSDGNTISLQHIFGSIESNGVYTFRGLDSHVDAEITIETSSVNQDVIPVDEQIYYKPVSFYDYEFKLNEDRRKIFLIEEGYKEVINKQLLEIMR